MPICIAGMHRSGTSMVAGLLRTMGVYLGEEADFLAAKEGENAEGFWEHFGFYALNEQLLLQLHAGWDAPWVPDGWEQREDLDPFRVQARLLADRMVGAAGAEGHWGWKDPRNSVTIQFWRSLLPDTKVVICVRNPAEVAASLRKRNNISVAAASRLWMRYYENLLSQVPRGSRVVTLYENYFDQFEQELGRVCNALGIGVGPDGMERARAIAKPEQRHHRATRQELEGGDFTPEVIRMYQALREEAQMTGRVTGPSAAPEGKEGLPASIGDSYDFARSRFNAETAQREEHMRRLVQENKMLTGKLATLEERLDEMAGQMKSAEKKDADRVELMSGVVEKAIGAYGLVAERSARLLAMEHAVEKSLKDRQAGLSSWNWGARIALWLGYPVLRIRKTGKMLLHHGELSEALTQSLGTLTHVVALMVRGGPEKDAPLPGLHLAGTHQTPVEISKLAALLRQRLL